MRRLIRFIGITALAFSPFLLGFGVLAACGGSAVKSAVNREGKFVRSSSETQRVERLNKLHMEFLVACMYLGGEELECEARWRLMLVDREIHNWPYHGDLQAYLDGTDGQEDASGD